MRHELRGFDKICDFVAARHRDGAEAWPRPSGHTALCSKPTESKGEKGRVTTKTAGNDENDKKVGEKKPTRRLDQKQRRCHFHPPPRVRERLRVSHQDPKGDWEAPGAPPGPAQRSALGAALAALGGTGPLERERRRHSQRQPRHCAKRSGRGTEELESGGGSRSLSLEPRYTAIPPSNRVSSPIRSV